MYIRYLGFEVGRSCRIYNFNVVDGAQKPREFSVKVQSEAFRSALRFQDGPDICYKRLEHELERETPESLVTAHLTMDDEAIREYAGRKQSRR